MLLIFFSWLSGNFDGESAVLFFNTLGPFFSVISVLNFVHSDDQCQILNSFLERVSNHNSRVEIVEGTNEIHVSVSSSPEQADCDELHNSGLFSSVAGMRFVDFNDFLFLHSVSSVLLWLFLFWLLGRNVWSLLCGLLGLGLGF